MQNPFLSVINQILPEPHAGLLSGMLFGAKSSLPKELYEQLIATGTIHIVALSGQNISILVGIISSLTLRFGRKISFWLTVLILLGFISIVNIEPSLIRAVIMGSMQLIAIYIGRQYWSLLSLLLAASGMLIINPSWIDEPGFQLSFLATLGIILIGPKLTNVDKDLNWQREIWIEFKTSLQITLAAQLFTLPAIIWHFGRTSLVSPLSNVLISPVIAPIMILGLSASILGSISVYAARLIGGVLWVLLSFLLAVVEFTSKFPYASISF